MGFFDFMEDIVYYVINNFKQTDVSVECEDSVRVIVDSGEIVFHSNLYNN